MFFPPWIQAANNLLYARGRAPARQSPARGILWSQAPHRPPRSIESSTGAAARPSAAPGRDRSVVRSLPFEAQRRISPRRWCSRPARRPISKPAPTLKQEVTAVPSHSERSGLHCDRPASLRCHPDATHRVCLGAHARDTRKKPRHGHTRSHEHQASCNAHPLTAYQRRIAQV